MDEPAIEQEIPPFASTTMQSIVSLPSVTAENSSSLASAAPSEPHAVPMPAVMDAYISDTAQYAASFQGGVYAGEAIPEFASLADRGSTPTLGEVHYRLMVLPRRSQ